MSGLSDTLNELSSGGAMGFFDRATDAMARRFDEIYSPANMDRMFDKAMDGLPPEWAEGLKQLFNMLSGSLDVNAGRNYENDMTGELYGAGGGNSERARIDANTAQRDDANYAAGVTIGTGTGAITEVNGIQYVNGKPVNDANEEDGAEYMREMGEQSERQREWERSTVNVGGVELSGEEWDKVYETLSDEEKRQEFEDELTEEYGGDRRKAKKAISDALELARIAQKKKDGTYTTADGQRAAEIVANNPDAVTDVKVAQQRLEASHTSKPVLSQEAVSVAQLSGQKSASIMEGNNLISSRVDFNAEPITPKYNTAASGLPVPAVPATPAADKVQSVEVAALKPVSTPSANGMNASLDMG